MRDLARHDSLSIFFTLALASALAGCGDDSGPPARVDSGRDSGDEEDAGEDGGPIEADGDVEVDGGTDAGIDAHVPICGDMMVEGTEECDDGNMVDMDGCTAC